MSKAPSEVLREAILACGRSRYALARESGVPESALSRFVNRERGLGLENVDRLAVALGLRLVQAPKRKGTKR
jgi:plasmid maintenance system antidote protein VapI